MKKKYSIIILQLLCFACGDPNINIDQNTYNPKIVVNGLLYTGQPISDIKVSRNYPLNTSIISESKYLTDALVTISDDAGITDTLEYSPDRHYHVPNQKVQIVGGKAYTLYIEAEIDGQNLWTSSTTTVPYLGFSINENQSTTGDIKYLRYYVNGKLTNPRLTFNRTVGAEFYGLSAVVLDASDSTFIENNIFGIDPDSLGESINYLKYISYWSAPDNRSVGNSVIELPWYLIYFYSQYRMILYAGDRNFYHFFISHGTVMNIDGNLREPLFYFEGDGIGLFGSAIRDTIFFRVTQ